MAAVIQHQYLAHDVECGLRIGRTSGIMGDAWLNLIGGGQAGWRGRESQRSAINTGPFGLGNRSIAHTGL